MIIEISFDEPSEEERANWYQEVINRFISDKDFLILNGKPDRTLEKDLETLTESVDFEQE